MRLFLTYTPAQACHVQNKTGSIETGKWADLTFIDGDPENDLDAFGRVKMVYKLGKKVYWNECGEDRFLPVL